MEKVVFDDCWKLLRRFGSAADKCQDAKFELFCQTWHELKMQHIYTAQTNHIEVINTTTAALHVAKRVACGRSTSGDKFEATRAQRIGAIYLMYAIYNKQPTKHFIKIEVSPRTWQTLTGFVEHLRRPYKKRRDTEQVSYIFWRLASEQAFRYTALDYCQALDALAAYDSLEIIAATKRHAKNSKEANLNQQLKPAADSLKEQLQGLDELTEMSHSLRKLETAYNKQMEPHRSSFAATNVFSQLNELFININESLLEQKDMSKFISDTSEQLHKRTCIRQKAMWDNTQEKHLISQKQEQDPDPEPEPKPEQQQMSSNESSSYDRRMSAARVFQRKLPDDVIQSLGR